MWYSIKFPKSTLNFNSTVIKLATLDLLPSDEVNEAVYDLPDVPAYNYVFEWYDYGSTFLTSNSGAMLWFVWIHMALILFYYVARLMKINLPRLGRYLFWSAVLRLFMESFFELALLAPLNVMEADWSTPNFSVQFSNYLSVLLCVVMIFLPLGILLFYIKRMDQWITEEFDNRFGEILAGTRRLRTNLKRRWTLMFYPMIFFARRLVFVLVTYSMTDFLPL